MHYLNISFSHKNSTLEIREKLSYPDEKNLHGCLKKLTLCSVINEAMLISTCNRMEVFCSCRDIAEATKYIFEILSARSGISIKELQERADAFDDSTAIHHIFSVASSLDSMVVGETQIAGQLKDAFRFSYDNGYSAKKIARAIKSAFKCASKVRNATDISSKPVSMASVAVAKLKSVIETLQGKKALIIGVGEMSEISAKHLISAGADVYIMNRTQHKAEKLANSCGAKVIDFEKLSDAINEFDILFTATSSHEPIIMDEMIRTCDFDRYWFDLALPRDIHHKNKDNVHLFVIDDLKVIVDENLSCREDAAKMAHGIIGRAVVEFFEWLNTLDIEPMIKDIYLKAYAAAQIESKRAVIHGYIPKEYQQQAQKMCEQTLKRFLHEMIENMRNNSKESNAESMSSAFGFLTQNK